MQEIIKQFIGLVFEYLTLVSGFWLVWAVIMFWTLQHPGDGRDRWLERIREARIGDYYRDQISRFLTWTAQRWFKDDLRIQQQLRPTELNTATHRWFGCNAFTESAFAWSLKMALLYPILSNIFRETV